VRCSRSLWIRLSTALSGLCWLSGVVAAHGEQGHSAAEQLPYAIVALAGIVLLGLAVIGERRSLVTSRRIVDSTVLGGVLLTLGGLVGLQLV
jgi:hypothetical protein